MATPTFNNIYTHMTTLLTPTPTHPAAADLATPGKKKRTTGSTPLPKSTLKSGAPGAGGYDSYADTEQVLDGESRKMLEGALSVVDRDGRMDVARGNARSLRQLVRGGASLSSIKTFVHAMSGGSSVDDFKGTALSLVRELEQKVGGGGMKRPRDELEGKAGKKYMLHRGLPTVDLFSSATELDEEDLSQLVHLEDTDVIAVESTPASNSTSRLRDINPRLPPISRPHPDTTATRGVPVTLLYYDPFSSFAPSHDSSDATLSYTETTTYRTSKHRIREHERSESSFLSTPLTCSSGLLTEEERQVLESLDGIDPELVLEGLKNEGVDVEGELEGNRSRLGMLRRSQWDKLRKYKGGSGGGEKEGEGESEVGGGGGGDHAAALLSSFTTLLAARPTGLIPSPSHIHALSPMLMNSLKRDVNIVGTLEEVNGKAVRESSLQRGNAGSK